ncbi:MAG: YqeG family HAD IIIA-type phosphatase [Ruminiclostridium sp.]|nr:YqeG family HAD IIIA-type phosphatase [Ruminiclostridium sp.]
MIFRPKIWIKSVLSIDEEFLRKHGIDALILDLDNTLSLHGDPAAEHGIPEWLDRMRALGVKMVVVSNNTNKRVAPLARKLGLPFIANGAKPLTIGITRALRYLGTDRSRTAVVGDQIFTDVMGGNFARTQTILVEPFQAENNFFFKIKRAAENIVFRRDKNKPEA